MEWKQVTKEEYEQAFQKIYKDVRDLMGKIEHDPNLGYEEGFTKWKQEIIRYQIIYPLVNIKKVLDSEIKKEKYR